jgi:death-on-curing protein
MPAFSFLGIEGVGRLDAALALVEHDYYDSDAHAVASMFWALIQDHPFQDGNKRFAVVATNVFLMLNSSLGVVSNDEWELLALSVARKDITIEALAAFFETRITSMDAVDHAWVIRMANEAGPEALAEVTRIMRGLRNHIRGISSG